MQVVTALLEWALVQQESLQVKEPVLLPGYKEEHGLGKIVEAWKVEEKHPLLEIRPWPARVGNALDQSPPDLQRC